MNYKKRVHIVAFDNPFPPAYGGIMDIYYKCRSLKELGCEVILHVWEYGRPHHDQIFNIADQVYYYERKGFLKGWLSHSPYIIRSRTSDLLNTRLSEDASPIIFEGIHTISPLRDGTFRNRKTLIRPHNIEHRYYRGLMNATSNPIHKTFFLHEAWRLEQAEYELALGSQLIPINRADADYFSRWHPCVNYLPPFHPYIAHSPTTERGEYILYQGNLSVPENEDAVNYLVNEVMSVMPDIPFCIAGSSPSSKMIRLIKKFPNIRLLADPTQATMDAAVAEAQGHVLYTRQAAGFKFKLLHALHQGRFVAANSCMVEGTELDDFVSISNDAIEMKESIRCIWNATWNGDQKRMRILRQEYDNRANGQKLMNWLFNESIPSL